MSGAGAPSPAARSSGEPSSAGRAPDATGPRVIYYTASSLDGFLATPEHSLDWLLQFGNVPGGDYAEFINNVGAVAMGGNTFRWLLDHEVMPPGGAAKPWPYEQPTWVFTRQSRREVPGANIRYVSGSVLPVHAEMLTAAACGSGSDDTAVTVTEAVVDVQETTTSTGAIETTTTTAATTTTITSVIGRKTFQPSRMSWS